MAVNAHGLEAEGLKLLFQIPGRHNIFCKSIILKAVIINDHCKMIQFIFAGRLGRFPNLSLVTFPIAKQRIYPVILFILLSGNSHSHGAGNALPQGACGNLDPRTALHIRVSLKDGAFFPQGSKNLLIQHAPKDQGAILGRAYMAFGQYKPVPVLPTGIFRIHPQRMEIQRCNNICSGQ